MEWFNKYAPVFMCVGRKPHPFVNEGHTICCGLTKFLCIINIVEGKDRPQQLVQKDYSELGKIVSLMLRICKIIFGTGEYVVLDSGLFVVKGITKLESKGVYSGYLINKWRHWT